MKVISAAGKRPRMARSAGVVQSRSPRLSAWKIAIRAGSADQRIPAWRWIGAVMPSPSGVRSVAPCQRRERLDRRDDLFRIDVETGQTNRAGEAVTGRAVRGSLQHS